MLGVYMEYSSACDKTRAVFSKDVCFSMRELFRFAVASAAMVCLTITNLYYYIPYEFVATARVPRGSGWQDIGAYVNLEAYYLALKARERMFDGDI
ncbi:protein detoxification 14 [Quercus suber]|uniref:Protein detoxification 14 n=1 Tax=Quercus suber TaxID=58331 RepID=A0AAW0KFH9_QUESU